MRYSEQGVCPDCRAAVGDVDSCPVCWLDLTTSEVATVRQALSSADAWLARAARVPAVPVEAAAPAEASPAPSPSLTSTLPSHPSTPGPPARRRWTAGGVILALGAACLVVASLIFVGVAWGLVGPAGRAAILLVVTAAVAGVSDRCTRRGLAASATALWSVFLGLLTIDWFFGRALGFAGLDVLALDVAVLGWAALVLLTAVLVGIRSSPTLGAPLPLMTVVAGLVPFAAGPAAGARLWDDLDRPFWPALVAWGVAVAVVVIGLRLGWRPTAAIAGSAALVFAVSAGVAAYVQAVAHPALGDLVGQGEGVPLVLMVAIVVAAGAVVPWDDARSGAGGLASFGVGTLVVLPAGEAWGPGGGWLTVAVLALVGAGLVLVPVAGRLGSWVRGLQVVVLGAAAVCGATSLAWLDVVGDVVARSGDAFGPGLAADTSLAATSATPFSALFLALVAGAVLATLLVASRWRTPLRGSPHVGPVLSVGVAALALMLVADTAPTPWSIAAVLLGGGAVLGVLWRRRPAWGLVGPAVVAVAPFAVLGSDTVLVAAALLAGLLLGVAAAARRSEEVQVEPLAAAATWWAGFTAVPVLALADATTRLSGLVLAVVAGALWVVAATVLRGRPGRIGVELAAGPLLVLALVVAGSTVTDGSDTAWLALVLTVPGAVAAAVAILVPDRRVYAVISSPLLGTAWVLRLVASDIDVVEAYTAPFAVVLLVAGVVAMVRRAEATSPRALWPGAALALVPSLPQALGDPTSLRAVLLAAVAATFLVVGLVLRWQVPFVAGSGVVALLVLVNVGPYAWALPRWLIIATIGILLTLVGTTWEKRVKEGRAVVQFLSTMR